jgi:hypothetical protein
MRGLEVPARCLAALLQRPVTSRGNDARRATLSLASRVPCTSVAIGAAEGFAGRVGGLSEWRRLTAQDRLHLGAKRKVLKLLPDLMELHGHSASFSAGRNVLRKQTTAKVKRIKAMCEMPG